MLRHPGKAIVLMVLVNIGAYGAAAAQEALKPSVAQACKCTCKECKKSRAFLFSFPNFQVHKFNEAPQVHIENAQLKERNSALQTENTQLREVINFIATDGGSFKKLGSFMLGISVGALGVALYYRQKLAKLTRVVVG